MRSLASVGATVLLVSAASAGIDLFLTRGPDDGSVPGVKAPDTFNPNEKDFLPNYVPWSGTPQRSPFVQEPGRTEIYYLWAEMSLPPNYVFAQIYGIDLRGSKVTGGMVIEDGLFYRQRNRWAAGTKAAFPGLVADVATSGVEIPINPRDLGNEYNGKSYALLAAIRLKGQTYPGKFQLGLGGSKFAIRLTDNQGNSINYHGADPNHYYPDLTIQGQNAYTGTYDAVVLLPEPSGFLLVVVLVSGLRRFR